MKVFLDRKLTVNDIISFTGADLIGSSDSEITNIVTDSKEAEKGSLFIAIKGEKFDGHNYINNAYENGAEFVLADHIDTIIDKLVYFKVDDTVKALGLIAMGYKSFFDVVTVAITGSIGKTTTKEFVYSVLSQKYNTHKTSGNFNNFIGLPLTLLGLKKEHQIVVLEMGMSARGEIKYLSEIAEPDIAIITYIGTSHIEKLGSREEIRNAKLEILCGMKSNGKIILNGDEPLLENIPNAYYIGKKNKESDIFIDNIIVGENGSAFDLIIHGERVESLVIPALGSHNVFDATLAYAVGLHLGMGEFEIRRGLRNFHTTGMRQNAYEKNGKTIIEDCYNASPESMEAGIKVLRKISENKNQRSFAVLGEMRELGSYSKESHEKVGKIIADNKINYLITFGKEASYIADSAIKNGVDKDNVFKFEDLNDPEAPAACINKLSRNGDVILFKASRAVAIERVLKLIN